ncbi:MAG: hypothetical protein JWM09_1319 [Francisellaceae bacterium]|nr:hypothetical protein [Francisellaceae bacterium]
MLNMNDNLGLSLKEIIYFLGKDILKVIGTQELYIKSFLPLNNPKKNFLSFVNKINSDSINEVMNSNASVILCKNFLFLNEIKIDKTFLIVDNPRLCFIKILENFSKTTLLQGIHPTACIHDKAEIHETAYIGPYCVIGKCKISANSVLVSHVTLYDNVKIGANVNINANTVIGTDGFGYERDPLTKKLHKFPHVGGVIIEDDVEIGSNTSIDRGTFSDTVIKKGTKIDNQVHIAHNAIINENVMIIAQSMIGGSVNIGNNSWIAPGVTVLNGIKISENCLIGLNAVVFDHCEANSIMLGYPARPLNKYTKIQKKLNKLITPQERNNDE